MNDSVNDSVLRKIKRCMELSKSSNENEAAIALKQMKSLMEKNGVTTNDIMAADITEHLFYLNVQKKPAQWVLNLHIAVANALDCECIVWSGGGEKIRLMFLGIGSTTEIAGYAFEVLFRKLKSDRTEFIDTQLYRYKRANKTKLADAYCEGWVANVCRKVANLNPNIEIKDKIQAYKESKLHNYNPDKRFCGKTRFDRDEDKVRVAINKGYHSSKDVNLFVATGHQEKVLIGECS